ncbi:WAP four-disulfide core domain protein 2 [Condylostylus longicornis]|uniref:WAP four-disulfide core domain protein 2 n=1 Tax=Condylostylus longicornis TaxID=2530218 RepID=UPI00244DFB23|nr:WAP four-disulfide core domain protein 2 [Condylostylus longicornis]
MAKLAILIFAVCLVAYATAAGDCPSYSKVQTCTPKCVQDSDCSAIAGKCCPNLCNARSCVQPNALNKDGNTASNKYGGGGSSYCGNVKCQNGEKCDQDKATKRPKCVRA